MSSITCVVRSVDVGLSLLYVASSEEYTVAVKPKPGHYEKPLSFPKKDIFVAEQRLFQRLLRAYEKKRQARTPPFVEQSATMGPASNTQLACYARLGSVGASFSLASSSGGLKTRIWCGGGED